MSRLVLGQLLAAPVLYRVVGIVRITDGDTLWAQRERTIGQIEDAEIIHRDLAKGVKIRLHDGGLGLDTPETDQVGHDQAKADLGSWVETAYNRSSGLYLSMLGRDEYGRVLGDLHDINGQSVCAWMRSLGWSGYPKPKVSA